MKKYSLEIIVFISGGVVMIFELVGSRIMAPHFGTSIFVWTNIIGVILGSLSLGYWLGGKVADRQHNQIVLSTVLLLAGLMIMLDALGQKKVFEMIQFFTTNPGWGSFIASCILFAFPSILFGIISPYAARLKMLSVTTSGTTVGSLYALSTLGSIIGTFLAGFVFIPLIGSTKILLILSIVLVVLSGICFFRKFIILKIALLLIIIAGYVVTIMQERSEEQQGIISRETAYNHVRIFDSTDVLPTHEIVKLMLNNTQIDSGMFLNKEDLVFDYTKFYRLGSYFNPHIQSALMLGGAGYSYPKDFLQRVPEAHLDVVEIDPELTELAYKYFRLPQNHPHLSIYHEDARVFLSQATSTYYDVIYGDAFNSVHALPFQLTTKEAVQKVSDVLKPNGVVVANIISAINGERGEFLRAEYATFKSIFPQVYLFPVTDPQSGDKIQNVMLVAIKSHEVPDFISSDPELQAYLDHRWTHEVPLDRPVLTDDYAPVDSYINKMLSLKQ